MNKRKTLLKRVVVSVFAVLMVFCVLTDSAEARRPRTPKKAAEAISEEEMPGVGMAWTAGVVLTAGAVMIGIKNAKRTHLD